MIGLHFSLPHFAWSLSAEIPDNASMFCYTELVNTNSIGMNRGVCKA